ncbi:MAG: radical SAM protein [Candidatus Korarchaeum sp.]|nr:radical SAM protein [Candidatus Korarchaeum sp.]MDW8035837.1 radical SAM protein [Candidatus Korarchaeum sp.]
MRVLKPFDPWGSELCTCPKKYSLHPYTGCTHSCLYCYATSYVGRRFSSPKRSFLEMLRRDLIKADQRIPVELSTSSDPYTPEELSLGITRASLALLKSKEFKVLITTKGSGFPLDEGIYDSVMVTVTTLDKHLSSKLEPSAPSPSRRIDSLAEVSVRKGVRVDPIIPGLNDDLDGIKALLREARDAGAEHVTFSMYKAKPDSLRRILNSFPEISNELEYLYVKEGVLIRGYRYLRAGVRYEILSKAVEEALKLGMSASVCREGFPDLMRSKSCDGTHLLST